MTEPSELENLLLRIIDPEELLYEDNVRWVQVPIDDGLVGIWPGHAPLIAALAPGTLYYSDGFQRYNRSIDGGLLYVTTDACTVLLGSFASKPQEDAHDKERLAERLEQELYESLSEEQVEELQKE